MAFNEHGQELGTAVAATATITFTDAPTLDSTVTLISTDGTSKHILRKVLRILALTVCKNKRNERSN